MGVQQEYLHLVPFPKQNTYNFSKDRLYLCDLIYSAALLYKTPACNFKIWPFYGVFEAVNGNLSFQKPLSNFTVFDIEYHVATFM